MDAWRNFWRGRLWMVAAVAMLAFVITDTIVHLRTMWDVTAERILPAPALDSHTPSGYQWNQHDLILPYTGMDGYHWVLQTQQMLAEGPARIRHVDYDDVPTGRDVHWSSTFRWWLAGVAWVHHTVTGTPLPQSVEAVTPYASTILMVLLVLGILPFLARRFGSAAATVFSIGTVAIWPFAESYTEGKSDHHGLAALNALLTLLFLVAGGAGWVRAENGAARATEARWRAWLPDRRQARKWFIASAIVGGAGLWISAASQAFVLAEIGLGALLAGGWLGRGANDQDGAKPDPTLWRVWGWAGAASSIFFYLLEYFPGPLPTRLEVNHPLYALAWLGGGELVYRLCRWLNGGPLAPKIRDWAWLGAGALAVAALPAVALVFFPAQTFSPADHFLYIFHVDYIAEFKSMARYLAPLDWQTRAQMANPVILLAVPIIIWTWRRTMACIILSILAIATVAFLLWWLPWHEHRWTYGLWVAAMMALAVMVGLFAWYSRAPDFSQPAKALMALTLLPGVVSNLLMCQYMRWMEISYALWLAALVAVVVAFTFRADFPWRAWRVTLAGFFLACILLLSPLLMLRDWINWRWKVPLSEVELMEITSRDVAQRMRARLGPEQGVVVSGPTTTTWMIYWGGFKGLGTLYWENIDGLKATAAIYSAATPADAYQLIKKYGVTHIIIFSWDPFVEAYARLSHGLRLTDPTPPEGFMGQLVGGNAPRWLRPIYYPMPNDAFLKTQNIIIFEVTPDQTDAEYSVRAGQYEMARSQSELAQGQSELARGHLNVAMNNLNHALQLAPDNLLVLVAAARFAQATNQPQVFAGVMKQVRQNLAQADHLALDDHVDLAIVLSATGDMDETRRQIIACLNEEDEPSLRRLGVDQLYKLLEIARVLNLPDARPGLWDFGYSLLPPTLRAQLLVECAKAAKAAP